MLVENERSWGIGLISEINTLARAGNLRSISKATGEKSLTGEKGKKRLFPDLLIHAPSGNVLMGWELKMPDTPITDQDLFDNAVEKARRLGTNSFILWNVNDVQMWVMDDEGEWVLEWSDQLPERLKREEVERNSELILKLLKRILAAVGDKAAGRSIRDSKLGPALGRTLYSDVFADSQFEVESSLKKAIAADRILQAKVSKWGMESGIPQEKRISQLAELSIVNWLNKVIFSHALKITSEEAFLIDELDDKATIKDYVLTFKRISASSDFQSIFQPKLAEEHVGERLFSRIREVNALMSENTDGVSGSFELSQALAGGLQAIRNKPSGQYSTPTLLARLLIGLTMRHAAEIGIDPCCGSGTLVKAMADVKKQAKVLPGNIAEQVWASDKFSVPLGLTGISLADPENMNHIQHVFQSDVLDLRTGFVCWFTDPVSGRKISEKLPLFDFVVSNLPFVRQEDIKKTQNVEKLNVFSGLGEDEVLPNKSDLYAFLLFGLRRIISNDGRLGLIVSNSWLATQWGINFRSFLQKHFSIQYIAGSAEGKWFDNAEVITTLLVLSKKKDGWEHDTKIVRTLTEISSWNQQKVDSMVDSILVDIPCAEIEVSTVDEDWLSLMSENGVNWISAAVNPRLFEDLLIATEPLRNVLSMTRGIRTGWDAMFFIKEDQVAASGIECHYLTPLLHNPRSLFKGRALSGIKPNYFLFDCNVSLEELEERGHKGAIRWIRKFEGATNKTGRPLPTVLANNPQNKPWYFAPHTEKCDFICQLNIDSVFGFYRCEESDWDASQRLNLCRVHEGVDRNLVFALLNSSIAILFQEATGFARGQGALDRSKEGIEKYARLPKLELIDDEHRLNILGCFDVVRNRAPLPILTELECSDRREFDKAVLNGLGLGQSLDDLYEAIRKIVGSRKSVNS